MAKKKAASAKTPKTDPKLKAVLDREPGLATTLQQIEKSFGEGSIMPLGASSHFSIDGIPTGSLSLDMALGGQGIPRGRIIEIYGPESSGKTTLALHVCAEAQKKDGIA
ncbi:MAG: DNA recombination/repair protein RecA, partial [Planctomycetota bacterium]